MKPILPRYAGWLSGVIMLMALCCQTLHAAPQTSDSLMARCAGRDSLYLQFYGGINKSGNENLPMSEFSSYPWAGGVFVAVGREVNALWGWRLALRFNRNKSRNVRKCETQDAWAWNSLSAFADATFDLTDVLVKPAKRGRSFNAKLFAGAGLACTFDFPKDVPLSYTVPYSTASRIVPAARVGLDVSYRIRQRWRVGLELSHNIFADRFNGVKTGARIDMRSNLKVGLAYTFGKAAPQRPARRTATTLPVLYDTRLQFVPSLPFRAPDAEGRKVRTIQGRAFLDFPVNMTAIYPDYRRNPEELERMRSTVESALFDKSVEVISVTLHGYASPESPYSNNTRLALGRTEALKAYVARAFNISEQYVETRYTPEDWKNLRAFIETGGESRRVKGDIWYEHAGIVETPEMPSYVRNCRAELLYIIDSTASPDEKEEMLKRVGGGDPYRWLLQHVFPGLRHTDYTIEYTVKPYSVKEACRLIYTHPEALSLEEMYKVAQSSGEDTDGWLDAMMIAARQYPESATANLNAACACVRMQRLTDAKNFLQKAGNTSDAAYVADVIQAMEGTKRWRMENGKVVIEQ